MATNPVVIFYDPVSGESGYGAIDVRISRTAANIITFDNTDDVTPAPTFIIDTINRRLGHAVSGTLTPAFDYHYQKEAANGDYVYDMYSNAGSDNFEFQGRRARGTIAVPLALADDDDMWEFSAYGHDGVAFSGQSAVILFEAAGTWSATSHGSRQVYKTTENGTITLNEVLVLGDDGCVVVSGQTNGFIGAVAGEYLRIVGATRGQGTIGVFANSTDTQPQSQLIDGSVVLGVGGVTAPDVRWRRVSAGLSVYDNNTAKRVFIIDATNNRVGGSSVDDTFTPSFDVHFEKLTTDFEVVFDDYGNNLNLIGRRSGGTKAAPTNIGSGLDLFLWGGRGWEGGAFSGNQAVIEMETSQAWSAGAHGTRIGFNTTANGGTGLALRYTIENSGNLTMNGDYDFVPGTDSQGEVGTAALRFTAMSAINYRVFAAAADANPTVQITTGSITMGAGGASAPDLRAYRTAASTLTIDNDAGGAATIVPGTTNTGVIGTNALKWNRIRATSVVTGDLELCDEERNAHWVFREETERIVVTNRITGKKYLLSLKEIE